MEYQSAITVSRSTLANIVRAAADTYTNDSQDQPARIAERFMRQARAAHKLAYQIEQADTITLED